MGGFGPGAGGAGEEASGSRLRIALWLATSLAAGAIILVLEMLAFRLYAPYFGYSIYVWGNMICVVMVALAAGYAIGGWLADRSRNDGPLYMLVLFSGAYQLVIVFVVHPLLAALSSQGEIAGTVLATLVVFGPPMIALATVGPFLIRLLAREGHVGMTAGQIYALSTVGSILGIIATIFYLVPALGTQTTLNIACGATIFFGVLGLASRNRSAGVLIALLGALPYSPKAAWTDENLRIGDTDYSVIWVDESAYNLIRVVRWADAKALLLNHPQSAHTIQFEGGRFGGTYFDDFALGPLLVPAKRALVMGMGAGSSISSTRLAAPEIEFEAVEIDPKVVDAAIRFFGLPRDEPWLKVHVADARPWLASYDGRFDIVQMDLYQGGLYIPFYLATRECFQLVRARMTEDALLMMNVGDPSVSHGVLNAIANTVSKVFPSVYILSRPNGNHMLFALTRAAEPSELVARLSPKGASEQIEKLAQWARETIRPFYPRSDMVLLTDDHSALEEITRRAFVEFQQTRSEE